MELAREQNASPRPGILAIGLRALLILFGLAVAVSAVYTITASVRTDALEPGLLIVPIVTIFPFIKIATHCLIQT